MIGSSESAVVMKPLNFFGSLELGRFKVRSNLPYGGLNDGNYFVFLPVTGDGMGMVRWWCFTICLLQALVIFSCFGRIWKSVAEAPGFV